MCVLQMRCATVPTRSTESIDGRTTDGRTTGLPTSSTSSNSSMQNVLCGRVGLVTSPPVGTRSIAISVSVCLSVRVRACARACVCVCVNSYISKTTRWNCTNFWRPFHVHFSSVKSFLISHLGNIYINGSKGIRAWPIILMVATKLKNFRRSQAITYSAKVVISSIWCKTKMSLQTTL